LIQFFFSLAEVTVIARANSYPRTETCGTRLILDCAED